MSYIVSKKSFSFIVGNETSLYFLKNVFLVLMEMELSSLKNKKFHEVTFRAKPALKRFIIFCEMELSSRKMKNAVF